MVDADLGITFFPEMAEGSSILAGTRVEIHAMPDDAYREMGLAWRKGGGRDREFRLLGGFVRDHRAACAICHSDIHYADGAWGGDLPAVYGHEASGVVEEVGSGVQGFEAGDHVVVTLIRSCGGCYHCAHGDEVLCEAQFGLDRRPSILTAGGDPIAQGLRTGALHRARRGLLSLAIGALRPRSRGPRRPRGDSGRSRLGSGGEHGLAAGVARQTSAVA